MLVHGISDASQQASKMNLTPGSIKGPSVNEWEQEERVEDPNARLTQPTKKGFIDTKREVKRTENCWTSAGKKDEQIETSQQKTGEKREQVNNGETGKPKQGRAVRRERNTDPSLGEKTVKTQRSVCKKAV